MMKTRTILKNGIYFVHPDGNFCPYGEDAEVKNGTKVGIAWDGHYWLVGKDYGEVEWSEVEDYVLDEHDDKVMQEFDAVSDWELAPELNKVFWGHIGWAEGETMPTCPMVCVMEKLARDGELVDALKKVGNGWKIEEDRWMAERYYVYIARFFSGEYGYIYNTGIVGSEYRVQGVALWEPEF